ncbi:MAG: type II toxin-antitoxin system RelE/ParE family toxin [Xanthomonadales bacterium]|nr:type II toxin-antitoxin system RelE/ParE family toxin [Xanthomonadales bacterium]
MKSVHWREGARRDLDDAAEWYAQQGGETLELRFVAAVESTVLMVRQHPVVGSTRHAGYVTDLPAPLRYFPIRPFESYLIYYIDLPEHIEVIRVWHAARGLDALLGDEESQPK